MISFLLPKDVDYFDYFNQHIKETIEACKELLTMTTNKSDVILHVAKIKELEHAADMITHRCMEALHKTFVTPFERTEIQALIKGLDTVIDSVDSASSRIELYEIEDIKPEAKALANVLVRASLELQSALLLLKKGTSHIREIQDICIKIHQLENEGDTILRSALVRLFKEEKNNPVLVIKWKEIFERLEDATDQCEDVANIISGIILELS